MKALPQLEFNCISAMITVLNEFPRDVAHELVEMVGCELFKKLELIT